MNTPSRNVAAVRPSRLSRLAPVLACMATMLGLPVHAGVSLPDTPMQTNQGVPPNIWFILDDSGSMAWRYMYNPLIEFLYVNGNVVSWPTGTNSSDSAYSSSNSTDVKAMYDQSYTTNSIYYNPNTSYQGWQRADGSYIPSTPYSAAFTSNTISDPDDRRNSGSINLGTAVQVFYVPLTANSTLSDATQYARYTFLTDGTARRCTWNAGSFSNCNVITSFTWDGVVRNLSQEKQNFANWYSYHRTRSKVAKAGASYAFNDESVFNDDSEYRVGFDSIWRVNKFDIPVGNDNGLFKGKNRSDWFDHLFKAGANDRTPLIPALVRAGEYFEKRDAGGPWGPQPTGSQFECRQNFTILTTDGYWNNTDGAPKLGNVDGTSGPTITRPDPLADPYTYTPERPFMDGFENTLADYAMHFWKRDLRPDLINTVPASASNPAFWQHMVTFGISIGLQGKLNPKTDLPDLTSGAKVWFNPLDAEDLERIDDLFHASVNGHGEFVAAGNPDEFVDGLGNALRAISASRGSGSNATVSGTSTSAGTKVFQAKFIPTSWHGELQAYPVSASGIDSANPLWLASIPVVGARSIYTFNGSAGTTFPTAAQNAALTPAVANYLRGDRSQEPQFNKGGLLRNRKSLLGDIVNSSPTYVKTSDTVDTVYVGANDGMLHAFNATDGVERFAYVPSGIDLAKLKEYSDPGYGHRFFVDGPIVTSTNRELTGRTVLVGSLGRGGRGLYALDITDPTIFGPSKVLWDKNSTSDGFDNMGLMLSKPIITKLNDGSTGVIVSNGLNSSSERAVLFVLDLVTGDKIAEIDTGVGSPAATNGLAAPRGWDEDGSGTVDYVYAGDFQGNVWKFDLSDSDPSQWRVANANKRPLYAPIAPGTQPITGGVTIAVDPATNKRWVFFGTGRLLTTSDISDTSRQTWYGVIDDDAATDSVTRTTMTERNIALYDPVTKSRAFDPNTALPPNSKGWYIDLDLPPGNTMQGERMVGDQQIVKNALIASSIITSSGNPCLPGRGYINAIDAFTGTSLLTGLFDANGDNIFGNDTLGPGKTAIGSIDLGVGMVTDAALLDRLLVAGGSLATLGSTRLDPALYGGRISWREIIRR